MKITLDKKWAYACDPETEVVVGIMQDGTVVARTADWGITQHDDEGLLLLSSFGRKRLVPLQGTVKGWFNVYGPRSYVGPHETKEEADLGSVNKDRIACIYMAQTTPPEED